MLSDRIVALRMRIFARINGGEGIPIPGPLVDITHFEEVYGNPAANGRSKGAVLSDLFWYWLSPGAEVHQEHLEPGPRYEDVARTTRRILSMSRRRAEDLAAHCASQAFVQRRRYGSRPRTRLVRLRDLMMPVWAAYYYEVVFGEPCPPRVQRLIVNNADDVVTSLKCCGLRHMWRRRRLTRYLAERIERGGLPHRLPASLSPQEQAFYLQGTFFNTAVVQMAEAMTHLLLVFAQHPLAQARVAGGDDHLLDHVIEESFRLYPLFGIAHRITSGDIKVGDHTLPSGSVVCFSYPDYHRTGFDDPDRFDPDRWENTSVRTVNHIPFGVPANRPCPASRLARITMRVVAKEMLERYEVHSSARHTRALPNRGPCLLLPQGRRLPPLALSFVRVRDRIEDPVRSVMQLVFGCYMVWAARRKALCTRYFEAQENGHVRT